MIQRLNADPGESLWFCNTLPAATSRNAGARCHAVTVRIGWPNGLLAASEDRAGAAPVGQRALAWRNAGGSAPDLARHRQHPR